MLHDAEASAVLGRCTIKIISTNPFQSTGDISSWTQLSLAASVVDAVCVRRGLGGRVKDFGKDPSASKSLLLYFGADGDCHAGSNKGLYVSVTEASQGGLAFS